MSYSTVAGHRSMALDAVRNAAYARALRRSITADSIVLDLGAGTGIHGLLAARLGARRVYLVEAEDVIAVAAELARTNRLDERIRCIHGRLEDVVLPEPVDIIVSALTGNFLLSEDLLPSLFHARDRVLKPGGTLLPSAATMIAVPVTAARMHQKEIASWSVPQEGIGLDAARPYAANTVFYRAEELRDAAYLAEPRTLHSLDFSTDTYSHVHAEVTYEIAQSGICHGWLGWFTMKLGDEWLSTSPLDKPLHWAPAFLPLDPPLALERGEQVSFTLDRAPFGDWAWRVRSARAAQRHSTLLSVPLAAATLTKAALDYRPSPTVHGRAVLDVLSWCDGQRTVSAIGQRLHDRYPERYATPSEALKFVREIVRRYT